MKEKICNKDDCVGCNACKEICPVQCISHEKDQYGTVYPVIESEKCIECQQCRNVCPANVRNTYVFPQKVYACWSKNKKIREQAASGGIASEIYRYGLRNGFFIMATFFDRKQGVYFRDVTNEDDLEWASDAKYVYSDMTDCFKKYEIALQQNRKCIFIGLPCQVAALKSFLHIKCSSTGEGILYIDIICHGIPNWEYMNQYLTIIEKKRRSNIENVRFRNLSIYNLCIYNTDCKLVYKKNMHADDVYYRAFEVNLDFRENCYHCRYARSERIADVTLGDYSGLGRLWPYDGEEKSQVSVAMCMTREGGMLLNELGGTDQIKLIERPVAEPSSAIGNSQLRHPSVPYKRRALFLREYIRSGNFYKSARKALMPLFILYYLQFPSRCYRRCLRMLLPDKVFKWLQQRIDRHV